MNDSWSVSQLVSKIKAGWHRRTPAMGAPSTDVEFPNTEAALTAYPHLRRWKSIVLDLAFEEYHLRAERGEAVNADDFCRRFPDYQRSLLHRIEIEQFLRHEEDKHAHAWPQPGDRFLGYRLLEQLGKGAVGRVYLAQQMEMRDRLVVVKLTPRGHREAQTLALLNHPHIVPIYRYDEDPATGLAAICMPYLSRTTLEDFLCLAQRGACGAAPQWPPSDFGSLLDELGARSVTDGTTPPGLATPDLAADESLRPAAYIDRVLNLARQMANALAHTHERGVLHLDLKPSNVLLLPNGRPLLLDFNLSVEGAVGASVIGGTLPYMSPEQLQEAILGRSYQSRPVDGRSDLFSLGVILYELLTGTHPFGEIPRQSDPREAAKELLRRHEKGPRALSSVVHDPDVGRFLDACLAFHPDQRHSSACEATQLLDRLLSRRHRAKRWMRQHRKSLTVVASGLLCGVLALATAAAMAPPEHEQWLRAAEVHVERREYREAEAALQKVIEHRPQSALAWAMLGQTQVKLGKHREATTAFAQSYRLSNDPNILGEMGHAAFLDGQYDIAEAWYRKAIERASTSPEVFLNLGKCSLRKGQYLEAEANFCNAVVEAPDSLLVRQARAQFAVQWAHATSSPIKTYAFEDALVAVRIAPTDRRVLFEAASVFALSHDVDNEASVKEFLERACHSGLDRRALQSPAFQKFADTSWFRELSNSSKKPAG
jgi:serine/threonine protein kinase/Tfp pilus assembly protein PilF